MDLINKIQGFTGLSRAPDNLEENRIHLTVKTKEKNIDSASKVKLEEEYQIEKAEDDQIKAKKKDPQAEALLQAKLKKYREAGIMEKDKMKEFLQLSVHSIEEASQKDSELSSEKHLNILG